MLFRKPKVILWPHNGSLDVYFDQKENNTLRLDVDLFSICDSSQIQSLQTYLSQNKIDKVDILIPDDVIFTKSFLYDSQITSIDKKEVASLAESFVSFKINPEALEFNLVQTSDKTIIQSRIFDNSKINQLKENLAKTSIKNYNLIPVSSAISKVISQEQKSEYFLLYPLNPHESTLVLSKGDSVYLTANFKNSALDIQKIINYSNLYFTSKTNTLYYPEDQALEINTSSELTRVPYKQSNYDLKFNRSSNLPLPVLGCIINSSMENINSPTPKKNLLPLIAVFVVTAAIASVVIWYFLNNSNSSKLENPSGSSSSTPTPQVAITPTIEPTPTVAAVEVSKKLKLQVLNATSINGQAATLKERLMKLGFASVTVGNATETATANIIKLKDSSAASYFQQNLNGFFSNATIETLPATSTYDAVFVIGEKLGDAAAPTASPTAKVSKTTPTPTVTE